MVLIRSAFFDGLRGQDVEAKYLAERTGECLCPGVQFSVERLRVDSRDRKVTLERRNSGESGTISVAIVVTPPKAPKRSLSLSTIDGLIPHGQKHLRLIVGCLSDVVRDRTFEIEDRAQSLAFGALVALERSPR